MRKILSLLMGTIFCMAVSAQTEQAVATARYTLKHVSDTTQPDNPLVQKFILYLGSQMSRYASDFQNLAGGTFSGTLSNVTVSGGSVGSVQPVQISPDEVKTWRLANSYIKQAADNKMSYLTMGGSKLFSVEEPMPAIEWAMSPDTKEIMGMSCQKANGRFKGRDYEAWFTTQLPYSNGPWKLGGLPGLILEAYDTRREVWFTLTEFKPVKDTTIEITIPATAVKASPKEYKQYRDALMQNARAGSGGLAAAGGVMTFSGTVSGGTFVGAANPSAVKPRQFNNPIEKEN